jgi:predicted aspartyl protease
VEQPSTLLTVSGPYGQYTVEAVVDPGATFTSVPAPALIELGVQPHRVVRMRSRDGKADFRQLGRALASLGTQEDIVPVLFGEPGAPAVIGATTLAILLLRWDAGTARLVAIEAVSSSDSE